MVLIVGSRQHKWSLARGRMKWKEWLIDGMMVMVCVAVERGWVGWRWWGGLVRELIFIIESRMTNAVGKAVGCFEERRRDLVVVYEWCVEVSSG